MKQWFYILSCCALVTIAARGATTIRGGFVTNETWRVEGSPYLLTGDVVVPAGSYLSIESGTEVVAGDDIDITPVGYVPRSVELLVRGDLNCVPSQNTNRIIFRGERATVGSWYGIIIEATNSSIVVLEKIELRHARRGIQIDSRVPSTVIIRDVSITQCFEEGIVVRSGFVRIDRVEIFGCTTGIACYSTGRIQLRNSLIHGNKFDGLSVGFVSIANCTIHGNGRAGVRVFQSLELANSLVTSNGNYGIATNSTFGPPPLVVYTHSIIWNNRPGAFPSPFPPGYNVGSDPQYTDSLGPDGLPGTGDENFSLRATSPAIDAGENGLVPRSVDVAGMPRYVDDPSIPDQGEGTAPVIDMGAFEFQPPVRFTMFERAVDGTMMLSFNTIPGSAYGVEASGDLRNWELLPGTVDGTGTIVTLQLTENPARRFFRVRTL